LSEELHPAQVRADKTNSAPCGEIVSPYFGPSDGDKKRNQMAKPRQKKAPVNQDDHVPKVQESQKNRTIRKSWLVIGTPQ
jgi:hypothetical protein